jgi:hypothetical protein
VAEYRAYVVGHDGHIISRTPLICADDAEAIERANQLGGGFTIELWSGDRLVIKFRHKTE